MAAKSVSFNFPKFTQGDKSITLQGDAKISSDGILALTKPGISSTIGRALYNAQVPIWDSATGNVASFVTSFSFVVQDSSPSLLPGDGIVLFLAPDSQIPNNSSGGHLGIIDGNTAFNQVVGVEFDSYINRWDPNYAHIGINVNSLISLKTVKWNRVSAGLVTVSIIYDSQSKELSVAVTNPNGEITTIGQVIDLKAVLPEKVWVGLSSTSGDSVEKHDIHSWSFTSTLV